MKTYVAALAFLLAISGAVASESCSEDVLKYCSQPYKDVLTPCNATYGGAYTQHGNVASEMRAYAKLYLERSYQYLLSASYYNNYQTNRGGFSGLFKKLSDEAWENTIDIIKHIAMRGDKMDFNARSVKESTKKTYTAELHEVEALAKALDTQKELAERAFFIHLEASKHNEELHEPEIAQYLQDEFMTKQAKTIRELAGHTSDLRKFISSNGGQDLSLALYLFDEYLKKA